MRAPRTRCSLAGAGARDSALSLSMRWPGVAGDWSRSAITRTLAPPALAGGPCGAHGSRSSNAIGSGPALPSPCAPARAVTLPCAYSISRDGSDGFEVVAGPGCLLTGLLLWFQYFTSVKRTRGAQVYSLTFVAGSPTLSACRGLVKIADMSEVTHDRLGLTRRPESRFGKAKTCTACVGARPESRMRPGQRMVVG